MKERMHGLRELVLLMGIFFGCALGFFIGQEQGHAKALAEAPEPVISVTDMENKCVAWFFATDLKAAKKRMCGGK
jgi:hypothetical protein